MNSKARCLLILLIFCVWSGPAVADIVTIHGMNFEVDRVTTIDNQNSQVHWLNEDRVVRTERVAEVVAQRYLSQPVTAVQINPRGLIDFVERALDDHDVNLATMGLRALLWHPQVDADQSVALVARIAAKPGAVEFFKNFLTSVGGQIYGQKALAAVLYNVALVDPVWLKTNSLGTVLALGRAFKAYVFERIKSDIQLGQLESLPKISEALAMYFESSDPDVNRLQIIATRLQDLETPGGVERAMPVLDGGQNDELVKNFLMPAVQQKVHAQAELLLNSAHPDRALTTLSRLTAIARTPTTHGLILRSLEAMRPSDNTGLVDISVRNFLVEIAGQDQALKTATVKNLEQQISYSLSKQKVLEIAPLFDVLRQIRPDPNPENDTLRVEEALALMHLGSKEAARSKLGELQTGLPIYARVRLLSAGYYINILVLLTLLAAPILFLIGIRFINDLHAYAQRRFRGPVEEPHEELPKTFTFAGGSRNLNPRHQEYVQCLRTFGLDPEASMKEIKAAYRQAVKAVHPDMKKSGKIEGSERFIELNEVYERLLALREELSID